MPFGSGKGLERDSSDEVNKVHEKWLNSTAFLGDLYAMGIVPRTTIQELIRELVRNPRCLLHMRCLYLLLSRCLYVTHDRIADNFLIGYGQELPLMMRQYGGANDRYAQVWRVVRTRMTRVTFLADWHYR